jgi:hypothetical protein
MFKSVVGAQPLAQAAAEEIQWTAHAEALLPRSAVQVIISDIRPYSKNMQN